MNVLDDLQRLADLHERGHLSPGEFKASKALVIGYASIRLAVAAKQSSKRTATATARKERSKSHTDAHPTITVHPMGTARKTTTIPSSYKDVASAAVADLDADNRAWMDVYADASSALKDHQTAWEPIESSTRYKATAATGSAAIDAQYDYAAVGVGVDAMAYTTDTTAVTAVAATNAHTAWVPTQNTHCSPIPRETTPDLAPKAPAYAAQASQAYATQLPLTQFASDAAAYGGLEPDIVEALLGYSNTDTKLATELRALSQQNPELRTAVVNHLAATDVRGQERERLAHAAVSSLSSKSCPTSNKVDARIVVVGYGGQDGNVQKHLGAQEIQVHRTEKVDIDPTLQELGEVLPRAMLHNLELEPGTEAWDGSTVRTVPTQVLRPGSTGQTNVAIPPSSRPAQIAKTSVTKHGPYEIRKEVAMRVAKVPEEEMTQAQLDSNIPPLELSKDVNITVARVGGKDLLDEQVEAGDLKLVHFERELSEQKQVQGMRLPVDLVQCKETPQGRSAMYKELQEVLTDEMLGIVNSAGVFQDHAQNTPGSTRMKGLTQVAAAAAPAAAVPQAQPAAAPPQPQPPQPPQPPQETGSSSEQALFAALRESNALQSALAQALAKSDQDTDEISALLRKQATITHRRCVTPPL